MAVVCEFLLSETPSWLNFESAAYLFLKFEYAKLF
jgi:hypothetical protein